MTRVHGKHHTNVLRSIHGLFINEELKNFAWLNFELSDYYDSNGRKLIMYEMT